VVARRIWLLKGTPLTPTLSPAGRRSKSNWGWSPSTHKTGGENSVASPSGRGRRAAGETGEGRGHSVVGSKGGRLNGPHPNPLPKGEGTVMCGDAQLAVNSGRYALAPALSQREKGQSQGSLVSFPEQTGL
jgi:hypothetical protein